MEKARTIARRLRPTVITRTPIDMSFITNFIQGASGITVVTGLTTFVLHQNDSLVTNLERTDALALVGGLLALLLLQGVTVAAYLASFPRIWLNLSGRAAPIVWSVQPRLNFAWPAGILLFWITSMASSRWPGQEDATNWTVLASITLIGVGTIALISMTWLLLQDLTRLFREWRQEPGTGRRTAGETE